MRKAEQENEIVYIIGHINPQLEGCEKRYQALLERFSHIIKAQIFGHIHQDGYKFTHGYFDKKKITGFKVIGGGVTNYNSNPRYHKLVIDKGNLDLKNYYTFYFNVTEANLRNEPVWRENYNVKELFETENFADSQLTFDSIVSRVENDKDYAKKIYSMNRDPNEDITVPDGWAHEFRCKLNYHQDGCEVPHDKFDWESWITRTIIGPWYEVISHDQ